MHKLFFTVPLDKAESVKESLFKLGLGIQGNYKNVSFETEGVGQFYPLECSNPKLGEKKQLTHVIEKKIEMLCPDELMEKAIECLKKNHPYESPAYELIPLDYYYTRDPS